MSGTKTVFKWFDITQHEEEQEYLRSMHLRGWKLQKVKWAFYTFEQCEPEDVVYQLDYHQEIEDRAEYLQMFRDCGWEYIQDMMGYAYFRKPVREMLGNEEAIFCDDESRMAMWDRVFKGRVRILLVILFCCIIPQLITQSSFDHVGNTVMFWLFVVLLAVYIWILGRFAWKYHKAKNKAER